MFQLAVYRGRNRISTLDLAEGVYVVGREPDCDLVIDHEAVSRRHLQVTVAGRRVVANDLETKNGTFVNGCAQPIRELALGDRIELGPYILEVGAWDAANTPPPAHSGAPEQVHSTVLTDQGELAAQRERAAVLISDHLVEKTPAGLREHPMEKRHLKVGFDDEADVRLPGQPPFARTVAEITRDPVGWLVRGVSGLHPVKVNGKKIRDHRLRDGDRIQVRGRELRFRASVAS